MKRLAVLLCTLISGLHAVHAHALAYASIEVDWQNAYIRGYSWYDPEYSIGLSYHEEPPSFIVQTPALQIIDQGSLYQREWSDTIHTDGRPFEYVQVTQTHDGDRIELAADGSHNRTSVNASRLFKLTVEGGGPLSLHIPYRMVRDWPAGGEQAFDGGLSFYVQVPQECGFYGCPYPATASVSLLENGEQEGELVVSWLRYAGYPITYDVRMWMGASVAPVPEPETWGMLASGLGLLALAGRRRRQRAQTALRA